MRRVSGRPRPGTAATDLDDLDPRLLDALWLVHPQDRECLLLRECGRLTYEEIAVATSGTVEAVRHRVVRARRQVRREAYADPAVAAV